MQGRRQFRQAGAVKHCIQAGRVGGPAASCMPPLNPAVVPGWPFSLLCCAPTQAKVPQLLGPSTQAVECINKGSSAPGRSRGWSCGWRRSAGGRTPASGGGIGWRMSFSHACMHATGSTGLPHTLAMWDASQPPNLSSITHLPTPPLATTACSAKDATGAPCGSQSACP